MSETPTCYLCGETFYKNIRSGPVCRGHYLRVLEQHLGQHAPKFKSYQQARADWKAAPLPLMEKTS